MIRVLFILGSIMIFTGCVRSDRDPTYIRPDSEKFLGIIPNDALKPRPFQEQIFKDIPADPDDSYSQGYQAGCQTMSSAVGEGFYRVRGSKIDPDKLTTDAWYLRGYNDGATACTFVLDWELH